jgi:cell filamentation protein
MPIDQSSPDNSGFIDPYVIPGTTVLQNLLGINSQKELENAEYGLTLTRRYEIEKNPVPGNFDLPHLCKIHYALFRDVYSWAGELRTVEISKGSSHFHPVKFLPAAADYTFGYLQDSGLLSAEPIEQEAFISEAAEVLSLLNQMHPFREGNGRAQRAFLDQVAAQSGRQLSWRNVGDMENTRASIESFQANSGKPFEPMIRKILAPPLDGLDPFEANIYRASAPL